MDPAASLDLSVSVWSLKGLSGGDGESARPLTLLVRNGQGVNKHLGLESQGIQKGSVSSLPRHLLDSSIKTYSPGKEDRAGEGGWIPSQEGPLPQAHGSGLPEGTGLTVLDPSVEPFFPFLKWKDHCEGPQATMEHSSIGRCSFQNTQTHTVWPPASGKRSARDRRTTHEGWHYRSCEDPLKPLVGLLCGGQLDLGGSFCLEVKSILVMAREAVGAQHAKLLA